MTFRFLFFCLFSVLLFVSSYVNALPSDAEQDLLLESETLEYNEPAGTITYSGKVLMQQGSMSIRADKVIIHGNANIATKVIAIGAPAHFQQTPKAGAEPVKAEAKELEYEVSTKSLHLQGDAFLSQEGTSLSGSSIEYDVQQSIVKAGSFDTETTENKRVRMVIPPKLLESGSN